jgi:hypothetical protein
MVDPSRIPRLYKRVSDHSVLTAVQTSGSIQLSTLSYFRSQPPPRGDRLEGSREVVVEPTETIQVYADAWPSAGNVIIRGVGSARPTVTMHAGGRALLGSVVRDHYIFSASSVPDVTTFGAHVYTIVDPLCFGQAIVTALRWNGIAVMNFTLRPVTYSDWQSRHVATAANLQSVPSGFLKNSDMYQYFCKPRRFSGEREWRYVFHMLKPPEQPVVRFDSKIGACCEFPPR